ncbi:MAG: glycogen/starch/alpha-glucan phosphorylase [Gammaproteobacteria bacterium]|nr:glycogen/starch/alpha-glucan phosphorylase [Gammaproteobacteria bacterium]MCP5299336.1 glycogen/starch/alpha-glucan phosphorylase [Chromatiaceae bacterium]
MDSHPSDLRERTRTGMSIDALKRAFDDNLFYLQGRFYDVATLNDQYIAAAYTVRDRLLERWIRSAQTYKENQSRTVCYLSAEFLLGPHLGNNLVNLGIMEKAREAAGDMGLDLDAILEAEEEPGLGNGGLGRLAACYMDSLATLQIPAIGYGIRYEFGIFKQHIEDGWQVEITDAWLRNGNPWELPRPKLRFPVRFGGHTAHSQDPFGRLRVEWIPDLVVHGMAYDTPILGYGVNNVNLLRLWKAEASESFDFRAFNRGDYYGAVNAKVNAENISKILYPNDEPMVGKELRLKQQYFFVTCSLQDMLRLHLRYEKDLKTFHQKFAAQLNDTHPAIAIPELMRLLVDEHGMVWDDAWRITRLTFAYTNHTLLPEALETWPVWLFEKLLPRHLEIIYEINARFLDDVRMRFLADEERIARMSIIDENGSRYVRMAHLACVGSHAINGVAELHTELLRTTVLKDFHDLWPNRFCNKTNGVTPRRFVLLSNPRLSALLDEVAGHDWVTDMDRLHALEPLAGDIAFQARWRLVKQSAKADLARWLESTSGVPVDPASLFSVQSKRIHEYKRQHLNILHVIGLYLRIKRGETDGLVPRTFLFGGKAAPGYFFAKLIIKLINSVSAVVRQDAAVRELLNVVFIPEFNVKTAHRVYPAADLSEQISLAGKEASGTGNMKFAMNGALTIGTLDGANVEIRDAVGHDNFFKFGLTVEEVAELRQDGYRPYEHYESNHQVKDVIDLIDSGLFSHGDRDLFRPITANLLYDDPYMVLADFPSYLQCQTRAADTYADPGAWTRMSILNVARIGRFSSDRAIREYCEEIWEVAPQPVEITAPDH